MSNILNSDDFGLKIYNRFPPKYREDDVGQNLALKRYLESLSDGGFKYSIDEINGITHLIDPDNVDSKVLPILFKQYGLEIFNGIPEEYLRYLLPKLGEAWSKKGSLGVVEFITSSLSGVKTTTNVSYDDQGNPLIDVKFEMDYNIGQYVPEAGQFSRLLEKFVPYYCDLSFLYSYQFYENQILVGKDPEIMTVYETKDEVSLFRLRKDLVSGTSPILGEAILGQFLLGKYSIYTVGEEQDTHKDKIIYTLSDMGTLQSKEEDKNVLKIHSTLKEQGKVKGTDEYEDLFSYTYYESAGIRIRQPLEENPETSAVFGEAIFGEAIFDVESPFSDSIEDHLTETKVESAKIYNPVDSFTNREYNKLNGSFYTNSLYCYDIITVGDSVEIKF